MNETFEEKASAYQNGIRTPEAVMQLLMNQMIKLRPRKDVILKAYMKQQMFEQKPISSAVQLDISKGFPQAELGSVVYAASWLMSDQEAEAAFTVCGNAQIWLNEEQIYNRNDWMGKLGESEGFQTVHVQLKQGRNDLQFRLEKKTENWGCSFYVNCPQYPRMWGRDYLLNVRCTLPDEELEGLEGAGFLGAFKKEEAPAGRIPVAYAEGMNCNGKQYRWTPNWEERRGAASDKKESEKNGCFYALTYCQTEKEKEYLLDVSYHGGIKVFLDGKVYSNKQDGKILFSGNGKERQLLVKCVGTAALSSFAGRVYEKQNEEKDLSNVAFVKTGGCHTAKWVYVGTFRRISDLEAEKLLDIPFAPEKEIQFTRPYPLGNYQKSFWRLAEQEVSIRPYQESIFFGQWFYAIQVGLVGLLTAAEAMRDEEKIQYFLDSIQVMAEHYDYAVWDQKQYGNSSMIPRACRLNELDPCGTIGVSMIEAYQRTGNEMLLRVIRMLADQVMTQIPRFEDDTFYRIHTMWADDFYMSCPFLVRLARLTGEEKYAERIEAQIDGFKKRLYMPDKKLFSHIYFPEQKCPNRAPWGRGNGWVAVTLTELLLYLPDSACREKALKLYQEYMEGICSVQDENGMWHQVLDLPETYQETSCTGMFLLSILRGIKNGWLPEEPYQSHARKAWDALLKNSIDQEGNVYGVCMGSGCSMDPAYYDTIPTHINDDHGTGILLMAAAELKSLGWSV